MLAKRRDKNTKAKIILAIEGMALGLPQIYNGRGLLRAAQIAKSCPLEKVKYWSSSRRKNPADSRHRVSSLGWL